MELATAEASITQVTISSDFLLIVAAQRRRVDSTPWRLLAGLRARLRLRGQRRLGLVD